MGEKDLSPHGFHTAPPGRRMPSMMAPTAVLGVGGDLELVLGSAGSNRIRSAILQTIVGVLDPGLTVAGREVVAFRDRNVFFGGVQAVERLPDGTLRGAGDPRRGGAVAVA